MSQKQTILKLLIKVLLQLQSTTLKQLVILIDRSLVSANEICVCVFLLSLKKKFLCKFDMCYHS